MMNSRAGAATKSSSKAAASPGVASNGKPFRIRLLKCAIDHNSIAMRKNAASRPSPARGSSLDTGKPSSMNITASEGIN